MRLWLRDSVDPFPIITCQRMVASYMACFHFLPIRLPAPLFFSSGREKHLELLNE